MNSEQSDYATQAQASTYAFDERPRPRPYAEEAAAAAEVEQAEVVVAVVGVVVGPWKMSQRSDRHLGRFVTTSRRCDFRGRRNCCLLWNLNFRCSASFLFCRDRGPCVGLVE